MAVRAITTLPTNGEVTRRTMLHSREVSAYSTTQGDPDFMEVDTAPSPMPIPLLEICSDQQGFHHCW